MKHCNRTTRLWLSNREISGELAALPIEVSIRQPWLERSLAVELQSTKGAAGGKRPQTRGANTFKLRAALHVVSLSSSSTMQQLDVVLLRVIASSACSRFWFVSCRTFRAFFPYLSNRDYGHIDRHCHAGRLHVPSLCTASARSRSSARSRAAAQATSRIGCTAYLGCDMALSVHQCKRKFGILPGCSTLRHEHSTSWSGMLDSLIVTGKVSATVISCIVCIANLSRAMT